MHRVIDACLQQTPVPSSLPARVSFSLMHPMLGPTSNIVPTCNLVPMNILVPMGNLVWKGSSILVWSTTGHRPVPTAAAAHLESLHCGIFCGLPALSDVFPQVAHLFNHWIVAQHLGSLQEALEEGVRAQLHTTPPALQPKHNSACGDMGFVGMVLHTLLYFLFFGVSPKFFPAILQAKCRCGTCCNGHKQCLANWESPPAFQALLRELIRLALSIP